jgi:hypothetical protein
MNKDLRFFAYYAALQMIKEDLNVPDLFVIIKEIFTIDREFYLKYIIEHMFHLKPANSIIVCQIFLSYMKIFVILHKFLLQFIAKKF